MTRNEAVDAIRYMKAKFPSWNPTKDDISDMATSWAADFINYPKEVIEVAIDCYVRTSNSAFIPSTSELFGILHSLSKPRQLSENEAWALVSKALRNGYYGAEEEFSKLPKLVQDAVGHPSNLRDWSQQDESALSVIQSNFQRVYRTVAQRETDISKMPTEVRALIDKINSNIGLEIKEVSAIEQKLIEYTDESAETEDVPKEFEEYLSKLRG